MFLDNDLLAPSDRLSSYSSYSSLFQSAKVMLKIPHGKDKTVNPDSAELADSWLTNGSEKGVLER